MNKNYRSALNDSLNSLSALNTPQGMEKIIRDSVSRKLKGSRIEVPLKEVGAKQINNSHRGFIDIVHESHGIELKVVRMPRLGAQPSNALYDVGQLTSDYWRLTYAKKLTSAELLVLVYGPLVQDLKTSAAICREFHNRLHVDLYTSILFSELHDQKNDLPRKRQISAARMMHINIPCYISDWKAVIEGEYALVSIPVGRT